MLIRKDPHSTKLPLYTYLQTPSNDDREDNEAHDDILCSSDEEAEDDNDNDDDDKDKEDEEDEEYGEEEEDDKPRDVDSKTMMHRKDIFTKGMRRLVIGRQVKKMIVPGVKMGLGLVTSMTVETTLEKSCPHVWCSINYFFHSFWKSHTSKYII